MVTVAIVIFSVIMMLTLSLIDVFLFHTPFVSTFKKITEQQNNQGSFFKYLIATTAMAWAIITDIRLHKKKSKS
ncbi:hypothetical protein ACFQZT_08735 [Paenibacillus sp. GCM10027628]|uniref:hypothetical protein n=1 Tax=Paenibacillus sp. GCM10027628 TaxID=3273413 RepID=UPI00362966FC